MSRLWTGYCARIFWRKGIGETRDRKSKGKGEGNYHNDVLHCSTYSLLATVWSGHVPDSP